MARSYWVVAWVVTSKLQIIKVWTATQGDLEYLGPGRSPEGLGLFRANPSNATPPPSPRGIRIFEVELDSFTGPGKASTDVHPQQKHSAYGPEVICMTSNYISRESQQCTALGRIEICLPVEFRFLNELARILSDAKYSHCTFMEFGLMRIFSECPE